VNSARSVRLALSPSPRLAAVIMLLHGSAGICFLTVLTGWSGIGSALLLCVLGAAAAWDRALLRGRRSPRAIEIHPSGEAICHFADGEFCEIAPRPGGVTRLWVPLRLRSARRRTLLVADGMLTAGNFRLLRLWALWGKLPAVARRQLPASS